METLSKIQLRFQRLELARFVEGKDDAERVFALMRKTLTVINDLDMSATCYYLFDDLARTMYTADNCFVISKAEYPRFGRITCPLNPNAYRRCLSLMNRAFRANNIALQFENTKESVALYFNADKLEAMPPLPPKTVEYDNE